MKILAIETSCDETAAAVAEIRSTKHEARNKFEIRNQKQLPPFEFRDSNFEIARSIVSSQEKIHAKFGGIVPEVAARKHIEMMLPVLDKAIGTDELKSVDAIAVTAGPGLVTSLTVGVETAKTLAIALNKPLIAVNHVEAHALAGLITTPMSNVKYQMSNQCQSSNVKKIFPAICLVVSGGHTQIILAEKIGKYRVVGETLDDAAGEAFDKAAKIMGLGYPGGPAISQQAAKWKSEIRNKLECFNIGKFKFGICFEFSISCFGFSSTSTDDEFKGF